jgi:rubrerythrin
MPNSLRSKLSKLKYEGRITQEEYQDLINKLDGHDQVLRELYRRRKGKWNHWTDDYKDYVTCSECEYGAEGEVFLSDKTPFCPICGADMRESDTDDK